MNIKAIETVYNGHRFRSRLEARWAVFFDALGIEWQYEPEGFEVGCIMEDGPRYKYLPDFYLPNLRTPKDPDFPQDRLGEGTWVEVKGSDEQLTRDIQKMAYSVDWRGPCASGLLVLGGIPLPPDGASFAAHTILCWKECAATRYAKFCRNKAGGFDLQIIDRQLLPYIEEEHSPTDGGIFPTICPVTASTETRFISLTNMTIGASIPFDPELRDAYQAARQARFEHGETATPLRLVK